MKRILVPLDFSKPSLAALDLACGVAKKYESKVIVLHVVEGASSESFSISGQGPPESAEEKIYTYKLLKKAKSLLDRLLSDPKYSSIQLEGKLRVGAPFHGIHALITHYKIDIVVMGVKGRSQWEGMIVGSNTEKVVRCSNVPVLTISKKFKKVGFKRIVYATSLLANEQIFSSIVRKLQKLYNSKIHFVHINTPDNFQSDGEVMHRLDKFAGKLKLENYTVNTYSDFSEEAGIIHFADSVDADLIALSSRGRTGFVRLLAGSIAEDVMNNATVPTLTYVAKR